MEWSYVALLTALWFLPYWILGGAFFALISVFRIGRLRKGRFSCLFSLAALAAAFGAAFYGIEFAEVRAGECLEIARANFAGFTGFFGCSLIELTLAFLGGVLAVIVLGALSMRLSAWKRIHPDKKPD